MTNSGLDGLPARVDMHESESFRSFVQRLAWANDVTPAELGVGPGLPTAEVIAQLASRTAMDVDRLERSVIGRYSPKHYAHLSWLGLRGTKWDCARCTARGIVDRYRGYAFVFACVRCGVLLESSTSEPSENPALLPAADMRLQRRLIEQLGGPIIDEKLKRRLDGFRRNAGPFASFIVDNDHHTDRTSGRRWDRRKSLLGVRESPAVFAELFRLAWDYAGSPRTVSLVATALKGRIDKQEQRCVKSAVATIADLAITGHFDADAIPTDIRYASDSVILSREAWRRRRQVSHALNDWVRGIQVLPPRAPRRDEWIPNVSDSFQDRSRQARELIFEVAALAKALACGDLQFARISFAPRAPGHIIRLLLSGPAMQMATPDIVERWRWAHDVVGTNATGNMPAFNYGQLIEFDSALTAEETLALIDYFKRSDESDVDASSPASAPLTGVSEAG